MQMLRILAVMLLLPVSLFSADLMNQDSVKYDIKIKSGTTTHGWINGKTTRMSVCTACTLEVVGVGTIQITSSDRVIRIKNGKLSK